MYKGQENTIDLLETLLGAQSRERYDIVNNLDEKQLTELRNALPSVAYAMRQLERDTKAVWIDRHADYEKYVRHAKKHFNDLDIAILELLKGNDEGAYYYRGILNHVEDELPGAEKMGEDIKLSAVRASVKKLKRRGLVIHALGLFDEDGFTAGSGFMVNDRRAETIEAIVNNYRLEQGELGLKA